MGSFLHSSAWERFQRAAGLETNRLGTSLYLTRELPAVLGAYIQSSRVELPSHFEIPAFARSACFMRLEPNDEMSLRALLDFAQRSHLKLEDTLAVQPRQTAIVDLHGTEEDLLARMKQKHRYNIRVASKHGVEISHYSTSLTVQIDRFWALLSKTAERHGFRTHPYEYYKLQVEELEKDGMAHLLFASHDGEDLAAMVLITFEGTATYLHGASSDFHKELMAPYLMHWEAMRFARERDCHAYDLWGTHAVYSEEKQEWTWEEGHPSAGTTRLKLGFGGNVINYPGTYDLVLQPFCYTLYKSLRALRGGKRAFA